MLSTIKNTAKNAFERARQSRWTAPAIGMATFLVSLALWVTGYPLTTSIIFSMGALGTAITRIDYEQRQCKKQKRQPL